MRRLRVFMSRVRGLWRGSALDQDIRDQIQGHLEEAAEEYVRQGLSPSEARRAAYRDFGGAVRAEEACRDARGTWLRDVTKDLGYAVRTLVRHRGFAALALISLAIGIGANTAIFSVVNALLLRPRAVSNPEEIVELYVGERNNPYESCSYPSYVDFRDGNGVFSGLAAYSTWQFRLTGGDQAEEVWGEVVSGNYFEVLGVRPQRGRAIASRDDLVPASPVVVIGHGLWQRRFNADPDLIGRTIPINGHAVTVVGIAPPEYTGAMRGLSSEVWVPFSTLPLLEGTRGHARMSRGSRWLVLAGRLKSGTTVEQAQARFDLLSRTMQENHPEEWKSLRPETGAVRELVVTVLSERDTRIHPEMWEAVYAAVALLGVIVNLVFAIACMNLAGMLLARAVTRRKEIAVRLALGAGRLRIIRQLVTESVLLSLVAGAAGLAVTIWLLNALVASVPSLPEGIRVAIDLKVDWRVFAYAIGFSMLSGVLFGLAPALHSSKTDVSTVMKDDAFAGGYRKSRVRSALVVAQVAFSLLLLIGAGLVLRSLEKVRPTRLGFSSETVLVASLSLNETQYERRQRQEFYRQLSDRISLLPGVQAVSLVEGMPGGFMTGSRRSTEIEGYQPAPGENLHLASSVVGPHYFTNLKVPIVQGRDFDERDTDGAPCVAIVNEVFSRRYFADPASAVGGHLAKYDGSMENRRWCEIVGVIRDNDWQSLRKEVRPFFALPLLQTDKTRMTVLVHTQGDPTEQIAGVRRSVRAIDPNMPVQDVQTLSQYFAMVAYPFRLLAVAMGTCGILALLLATIGVYGVVSYSVAQRTREVGIRMALGALRREILALVIRQGMTLVTWGLGTGLLLSFALTRVLTSSLFPTELLFGVTATDSLTFAGVTILLASVALVACWIPARRATRVDPIEALRYE